LLFEAQHQTEKLMLNDALAWGSCIGAWEILLSLSQNWKFGLDERLNSEFSCCIA